MNKQRIVIERTILVAMTGLTCAYALILMLSQYSPTPQHFYFQNGNNLIKHHEANLATIKAHLEAPSVLSISPDLNLKVVLESKEDRQTLILHNTLTRKAIIKRPFEGFPVNCTWITSSSAVIIVQQGGWYVPIIWHFTDNSVLDLKEFKSKGNWAPPVKITDNVIYFFTTDFTLGKLYSYDLQSRKSRLLSANEISGRSDVSVSTNGEAVAAVSKLDSSKLIIISVSENTTTSKLIQMPGRVKEISSGPSVNSFLVVVRGYSNSNHILYLIKPGIEGYSELAREPIYEIRYPKSIGQNGTYCYQVTSATLGQLFINIISTSSSAIAVNSKGFLRPIRSFNSGRMLLGNYTSDNQPTKFVSINADGLTSQIIEEANSNQIPIVPKHTYITSNASYNIPCVVWEPDPNSVKADIIFVHGGPKLHIPSSYDSVFANMARLGIRVTAINYRGSTGYGIHYEDSSKRSDQVEDLTTVYDHVKTGSEIPIVVLAHSYGTQLVMEAATSMPNVKAFILLSPTGLDNLGSMPVDKTVILAGEHNSRLHHLFKMW